MSLLVRPEDRALPCTSDRDAYAAAARALHSRAPRNAVALAALRDVLAHRAPPLIEERGDDE